KGLSLRIDCPVLPALWLDGHRLRQIVWNLLSNAIRYTDNGHIELTSRYHERQLEIWVRDTGVGIPDEIKAQLFRPFARGKNRRPGSSGLGMAIVHELVLLFGGSNKESSQVGAGSCFRLLLPALEAASMTELEDAGPQPGRILLLDEATSHIDSETEQLVQRALEQLHGQITLISIAHRLSTIRDADRIIVLNHGQIAETGDHEELMTLGGIYQRLYLLQQLQPEAG
ncbi:sensor histidine kinase KdpD, partial [Pseudomonas sp. MWU12-2323]|uniref:sensor histidine kinase n=1 Tax=Pseudomonas sp. MWU12-2323 TaxID=2651296 RepID=UPI00137FE66A